ncbi:restriction endonuclease subunit S [Avibacterium endocarditidis]
MKNHNIPKLRYPEFTDAWEKWELGDLVNINSGKDYKHLSKGNIPVYGTGGYMLSVNEALSYGEDAIGIGRKGTIDKPYILKAPFWTVDTLFYAIPYVNYDLNFIFCIFQITNWKEKDESTGVPSLSKTTISKLPVRAPTLLEQQKIGNLFKQLDRLITLHKRKWDDVILLKKALLQKMFPKNGSDFPEIRFPEFTDAWEKWELGDLVNINSGKDYKHLSKGNIPVYGTGGYMLSVNEALSYGEDAIGIGRKGTIDKPYILKAPFWTVDTLFYAIPYVNYDLNFIFCIFQITNWKEKDESTGVPSLSKTTISKLPVRAPTLLEQQKIGNLFKQLDRLITLHKRQHEHYQLLKKALLQQMFV